MRKAIIETKYDISCYKGRSLMEFKFNKYGLDITSKYDYSYTLRQTTEHFRTKVTEALLEIKPKAYYAYDSTIELLDIIDETFDDYALIRVNNKVLKLVKVYTTDDGNTYINLYRHRYHLIDFMRV